MLVVAAFNGCWDEDALRRMDNAAKYGPNVGRAVSAMQDEIKRVNANRVKAGSPSTR